MYFYTQGVSEFKTNKPGTGYYRESSTELLRILNTIPFLKEYASVKECMLSSCLVCGRSEFSGFITSPNFVVLSNTPTALLVDTTNIKKKSKKALHEEETISFLSMVEASLAPTCIEKRCTTCAVSLQAHEQHRIMGNPLGEILMFEVMGIEKPIDNSDEVLQQQASLTAIPIDINNLFSLGRFKLHAVVQWVDGHYWTSIYKEGEDGTASIRILNDNGFVKDISPLLVGNQNNYSVLLNTKCKGSTVVYRRCNEDDTFHSGSSMMVTSEQPLSILQGHSLYKSFVGLHTAMFTWGNASAIKENATKENLELEIANTIEFVFLRLADEASTQLLRLILQDHKRKDITSLKTVSQVHNEVLQTIFEELSSAWNTNNISSSFNITLHTPKINIHSSFPRFFKKNKHASTSEPRTLVKDFDVALTPEELASSWKSMRDGVDLLWRAPEPPLWISKLGKKPNEEDLRKYPETEVLLKYAASRFLNKNFIFSSSTIDPCEDIVFSTCDNMKKYSPNVDLFAEVEVSRSMLLAFKASPQEQAHKIASYLLYLTGIGPNWGLLLQVVDVEGEDEVDTYSAKNFFNTLFSPTSSTVFPHTLRWVLRWYHNGL